jgi:uncharacterized protein involved in exopolysaccharide biosynthesis
MLDGVSAGSAVSISDSADELAARRAFGVRLRAKGIWLLLTASNQALTPRRSSSAASAPSLSVRRSFGVGLRVKLFFLPLLGTAVVLASLAIYPLLPRSYEATALVLLQATDRNGQPDYERSGRNALDENAIQAYSDILAARPLLLTIASHHLNDPEFNTTLRPSHSWLMGARSWLPSSLITPRETIEDTLRKHLIIRRDRKSYVLQVGFSSIDPNKAADMANTLVTAFVADQQTSKQRFQNEFVEQLRQRSAELEAKYRASEAAMNSYLIESGLIHKGERISAERRLETFSVQFAQATTDARTAEDRARTLLEMQRRGTLDGAPEVISSPVIRAVKERIMLLNSSASPTGTALTAMTDIRTAISGEAERIVRASQTEATILRQRADTLRDEINRIDTQLTAWHEADRQLAELQRTVDLDRTVLQDAMAQLRVQTGRAAMLRPDVEVISPAVAPVRPAFPDPFRYVAGTLLLVLIGCAAILLLPGRTPPNYPARPFGQG